MRVKRVLNNNSVIATDDENREFVAIGRGLGHGRKPGDILAKSAIDQVFVASEGSSEDRLSQFLADIPLEYIRAAGRIADLARDRLGIRVGQSLILPLADHLHFAVQRIQEAIPAEFPLAWEVSQLYPQELATGREAVEIARQALGVQIEADEAVALALHFVNAQFAAPGMSRTFQMTEIITHTFGIIDQTFAITVDQQSMNAARFVTHLRYLFSRVASGRQITEDSSTLADAIAKTHAAGVGCAAKIQYLLEMKLSTALTRDEVAYLGLHVSRLVADVEAEQAAAKE
ncbi:PRD domain-containing protein [Arthrobacter silvisoli]|uniref:PRD domain-containing protein n=1 Tax=Arthrobacter silvisoli TaxID=2291022 RepID=UPI000E210DA1|nr:PRD domain-containing protein [Arthrobacter silvisoli]